ncbi:MAG: hypothetical protein CM15mP115_04900 [Alphaproteobacteria bacterium]|nr:MAG: hypothetical protein CM15mP115_04900 [Alphaproteobacteria bacterium]
MDAALYAQNLVIAAESAGLGICYIGALRNDPAKVTKLLDLPQQVYPVFGLCLGHPAQDPEVKPRLPVSVTLKTDSYSTDGEDEAIAAYDEEMRTYYANRSANIKIQGWSRPDGRAAGQGRPPAHAGIPAIAGLPDPLEDHLGAKGYCPPQSDDGPRRPVLRCQGSVLVSRRGGTARFSGSGSSPP